MIAAVGQTGRRLESTATRQIDQQGQQVQDESQDPERNEVAEQNGRTGAENPADPEGRRNRGFLRHLTPLVSDCRLASPPGRKRCAHQFRHRRHARRLAG